MDTPLNRHWQVRLGLAWLKWTAAYAMVVVALRVAA